MRIDDLPMQFKPYDRVKLGTNTLIGVTAILSVKGNIPLLIGQGDTPRIWLYIPANKEGTDWFPIIKDNFSSHVDIKVTAAKKHINVRAQGEVVLSGSIMADGTFSFLKLDLRPFGLNLFADEGKLMVLGSELVMNTFNNLKVIVSIE